MPVRDPDQSKAVGSLRGRPSRLLPRVRYKYETLPCIPGEIYAGLPEAGHQRNSRSVPPDVPSDQVGALERRRRVAMRGRPGRPGTMVDFYEGAESGDLW